MRDWELEIRDRLRPLRLARWREDEIVEELSQHLDDRFADLRSGMPPDEARRATLEELAGDETLRELVRGAEREPRLESPPLGGGSGRWSPAATWRDLRFAARSLRKTPGFSSLAILTLALSIGATVTIFALVDAVLLRPLPFPESDRLVRFWGTVPEKGLPEVDFPDAVYEYLRTRTRVVSPIAGATSATFTLVGDGDAERLQGQNTTVGYFSTLGIRPLLGRDFRPEEGTRGNNLVTVISHGLWQRRFGGDTAILGRAIDLNGYPTTVVGIMPPDFAFSRDTDLWIPIGIDPQSLNCWCYAMLGRLAPGATPDDAAREVASLLDDFWREREPGTVRPERSRVVAVPLSRDLTAEVNRPLVLLLAAVGLVLLIACANIANLLLARGTIRRREIAIRCCLGATSPRIVRQLLIESALLAAAGALGGLLLAQIGVRVLGAITVARLPHMEAIGLHGGMLVFAVVVAMAAAMLFGIVPALRAVRIDLAATLKDGGRGTPGTGARRLNRGFVVAQFTLSLVLLVAAALALKSFRNLLGEDRGFLAENVLVARLALPGRLYRDEASVAAFQTRLLERVRVLPDVREVGLSQTAPFSAGDNQQEVYIEERPPAPGEPIRVASIRGVSPSYFAAIGTPIVGGRGFENTDASGSTLVAVIDESLARRYWPEADPVGKRIRVGGPANPFVTVVGVARSVKHHDLARSPDHYVYVPTAQSARWTVDLVVRTGGDPLPLVPTLRREVRAIDPRIPLYQVHTLDQAIADSLRTRRMTQLLLLAFAGAALLLASVGVYGVMALGVGARTNEFGIRLALGARPGQVRRLVLAEGLRLAIAGVAIGLVGAALITRGMGSLLYGVEPFDAGVFAAAAALMTVAALAACYAPARRATETDPITALRAE